MSIEQVRCLPRRAAPRRTAPQEGGRTLGGESERSVWHGQSIEAPQAALALGAGRVSIPARSGGAGGAGDASPERGAGAHGRDGVELSGDLPPESMSPG